MAGSLGRDESEAALVHFLDQELVVNDELLALEKSLDNQLKEKKPSGKRTSRDNCQVLKYGPKGRVYSGTAARKPKRQRVPQSATKGTKLYIL
jgi:hypothetical protein